MATPYGATPDGVRAMVLDVAAEGARTSTRVQRVSDQQIEEWLEEAAARVSLRAAPWTVPVGLEPQVETLARHLVQLYAAALLWDATHPERGGMGGGAGARLSDSLMARYTAGVGDLVATLTAALGDPVPGGGSSGDGDDGTGVGGPSSAGAAAVFPPPMLTRVMGF